MQATRKSVTSLKKGRSRITNNRALFPRTVDGKSIDERGKWSRRMRDLITLHTADLGGPDNISEAERALIRSAATLRVSIEHLETTFALEGEATQAQLESYQRLANTLRRLLSTLGIKRRPKDVTPDLKDYVASLSNGRDRNHGRARVIEHGD
jgi:hypothetical protein